MHDVQPRYSERGHSGPELSPTESYAPLGTDFQFRVPVRCLVSQERFDRIAATRRRQKEQHKLFLAALKTKRLQDEVLPTLCTFNRILGWFFAVAC